jgi:hypothetical protein
MVCAVPVARDRRGIARHALRVVAIVVILTLWPSTASAQDPGVACLAARSASWTAQEVWVWNELCERREGDLSRDQSSGAAGDVTSSQGWSPNRALRAEFIEEILTLAEFNDHLSNRTVEIRGALFRDPIDLEGASVRQPVYFIDSRFEASILLRGVHASGNIGFDGSALTEPLVVDGAVIEGSLFLRDVTIESIDATGTQFGGAVTFSGSTVASNLDLNGADLQSRLFLNDAQFHDDVDLIGAHVGGAVYANHSTFEQGLLLYGAEVGAQLLLAGSQMHGVLNLTAAELGGTLALADVDGGPTWYESSSISLVAATVNAIDDSTDAWPEEVHLEGFVLEHAHGQGYVVDDAFADRSVDWYLDWLQRDDGFSRGAYIQLETLLRSAGRPDEADEIGMARAAEDAAASTPLKKAISPIYRYTVGYGYHPEWAVFWTIGLVLLGAVVALRVPRQHLDDEGAASRVILSAHRLIPLISFGKAYAEVDVTSTRVPRYVRWYFYLHAILGYVLAAALVAAVSGAIATK